MGIILGSFLNAWEWRISVGKSIARGRSVCTKCMSQLSWYDNIPVASFVFLGGKCRQCKQKISWQYPIVEITSGLLFAFVFWFYTNGSDLWSLDSNTWLFILRDFLIVYFLLAIFLYDLKHQMILDRFTLLPAVVIFFINTIIFQSFPIQSGSNLFPHCAGSSCGGTIFSMTLGVLIGGGFFLAQYLVSKGKWIGGGDIRLGVFMGVILGWKLVVVALFLAYIVGALVSVPLLLLKKKTLASRVPFGTYLTVATVVVMFFGEKMLDWYLGLVV